MTNAERKLLEDAIETAIREEREKISLRKWTTFFMILSVSLAVEVAILVTYIVR